MSKVCTVKFLQFEELEKMNEWISLNAKHIIIHDMYPVNKGKTVFYVLWVELDKVKIGMEQHDACFSEAMKRAGEDARERIINMPATQNRVVSVAGSLFDSGKCKYHAE
jgi:hypothetical protein